MKKQKKNRKKTQKSMKRANENKKKKMHKIVDNAKAKRRKMNQQQITNCSRFENDINIYIYIIYIPNLGSSQSVLIHEKEHSRFN